MKAVTELNKWDVFDSPEVAWEPHAGQEAVVSSPARFRAVAAGRRFGKSDIGGHELIPEAWLTYLQRNLLEEQGKRREFWIVGPEYSDSEKEFRIIWNQLKKQGIDFDRPGSYYNAEQGDLALSCFKGRYIVKGQSAKYPDTLVGEGLSGVILAEAAKLKERIFNKYILPTLADFIGWALLTSTPEGRNWFHDKYKLGQDPRNKDWKSWRFPAWKNPYVYRKRTVDAEVKTVQQLLRRHQYPTQQQIAEMYDIDDEVISLLFNMTEEAFNQEIAALFTEFVGRVFKQFDADYHVRDLEYQPGWRTFAVVDYGFTNPNVWLLMQEGPWGELNVLDELYRSGLTTPEFGEEILANNLCPAGLSTFYPDPQAPGDTKQLESILKVRHTGGTGGELKPRLDAIRKALKPRLPHLDLDHPENRPTLAFSRRCANAIREFEDYRYPEKRSHQVDSNSPESPMKKDDHCPEAIGRYFAAIGTPADEASATRLSRAEVRG